jgi:hypothetical protein
MDEPARSDEPSVSGFGGHPLAGPSAGAADRGAAVPGLAELGLLDAEQLVAAASVPGVAGELQAALGLGSEAYQALLESALGFVPPEQTELLNRPTSVADLHLGALPPTAEMLAAAERTAADARDVEAARLPPSVDLRPFLPPIRSQASRGTCVAFTLTALNEYAHRRRGVTVDLSEQHLYYETKRIDGSPDGCGTWQAKAVLPLGSRGQCAEPVWPYDVNPPCNNHGARPAGARPDGLRHTLTAFPVATRSVAAYKAEMARQLPVTLSIPVYDSWYRSAATRQSGRITMRIGNETETGGHAVCLVGYQDAADSPGGGYFVVRNSWGTGWAYQSPYGAGYGTIPYRYITNDAWEAFSTAVPEIGADAEGGERDATDARSSVVIEVGRNVRITIETG